MPLVPWLDRLSTTIEQVAGVFLGVITVLVFASALGRHVLASPIPDAFDDRRRVGIAGVDLVAELLPERARRVLDVLASLVLLLFTVLLAAMLLGRVESAYASNESTFDLRLPVWPWLAAIWLGVLASVFTIVSRLVLMLLGFEPSARSMGEAAPE